MRRLVLFMHTTLDGFVAGPNGEMNWINVDDEIFNYAGGQTDLADTALYGRVTYQMMQGYWPTAGDQPNASKHDIEHSRWYNKVTKVVLSKTIDKSNSTNTVFIKNNIAEEIEKLKHQKGKNILVFGSPTAVHTLMRHNLIDDYWIFVNPVILGSGIPLFKDVNDTVSLKLLDAKFFSSGVVGLHYER